MSKESNKHTFLFALYVCVACSFMLSLVSEGLRSRKELNVSLDKKKNILKAVQLRSPLDIKATPEQILSAYEDKIKEKVVDANGKILEDKAPEDIADGETYFPLYVYKEGQEILGYAFPVVGKGLWSTLKGYLSLEPDAKTIRGITFYSHGETPGLGAEIEKDWFLDNFKGKTIWDESAKMLVPTSVVKGKVVDFIRKEEDQKYYVDGISGATMTSKGVTAMMDKELNKYEPFFKSVRKINF